MNNIISALVMVAAFLFIFDIYVLYKLYEIENKLEKLNIEVMTYKNTAMSIIKQIVELKIPISAEKSQS